MTSKRYHIVVASVLFAVLMWVSVNLGYEYQMTKQIPLVITGLSEKTALKHPIPKTLAVRIRGTGWRLVSAMFSGEERCVLHVGHMSGTRMALTDIDLKDQIRIAEGIVPTDISPDTLIIEIEQYGERKVRVVPEVDISYPDGYGVIGEPVVLPESVLIGGALSVIKDIESWPTKMVRLTNLRESVAMDVDLAEPSDQSAQPLERSVRLSIHVQPFAEKTFVGVPVVATAVPLNREVIFIPPRVDITVRGGIAQLATLAVDDFQVSVNYEALLADTLGTATPSIASPPSVRVIQRRPERVQFIIRKRL